MTECQRPQPGQAGRPAALAVAPQKFGSVGRIVTAHTTLAEPLISVEGPDMVLTPREATALSELLVAACAEIYRQRPDIAQFDQLDTAIKGTSR